MKTDPREASLVELNKALKHVIEHAPKMGMTNPAPAIKQEPARGFNK